MRAHRKNVCALTPNIHKNQAFLPCVHNLTTPPSQPCEIKYLHGQVDLSDDGDDHGGVYGDQQEAECFLALSLLIGHVGLGHQRKKVAEENHDAPLRQD